MTENALMIRRGVLDPSEICDPRRFVPVLNIAGGPYSGKTTAMRRIVELCDEGYGPLFTASYWGRIIPDTTRGRRVLEDHRREENGDPFWFVKLSVMRRDLERDQLLGRSRQADPSARDSQTLRQYVEWAFFANAYYGIPRRRLWQTASQYSGLWYEGSPDKAEVLSAFFYNSRTVFLLSDWYFRLDTDSLDVPEPMDNLLVTYRYAQSKREQRFRILYGSVVTGVMQDALYQYRNTTEPVHADFLYRVKGGKEGTTDLAHALIRLHLDQSKCKERRRLLQGLCQFLKRKQSAITKLAWSSELAEVSTTSLPRFIESVINPQAEGTADAYYYGSPLTYPEPALPGAEN